MDSCGKAFEKARTKICFKLKRPRRNDVVFLRRTHATGSNDFWGLRRPHARSEWQYVLHVSFQSHHPVSLTCSTASSSATANGKTSERTHNRHERERTQTPQAPLLNLHALVPATVAPRITHKKMTRRRIRGRRNDTMTKRKMILLERAFDSREMAIVRSRK